MIEQSREVANMIVEAVVARRLIADAVAALVIGKNPIVSGEDVAHRIPDAQIRAE